jgi:predicted HTH domain antitoxin
MNITIDLPESYKLYFGDADIEHELKKNSALILYKQGKISLSKASELSDMNIYDFIYECKKNQIPVIEYSSEEIDREFENIQKRI